MSQHTPTPWKIEESCGDIISIGGISSTASANDDTDLRCWLDVTRSDAEFVVRACNAHEELISALRETLDALYNETDGEKDSEWIKEVKLNAKKALEKAGVKV